MLSSFTHKVVASFLVGFLCFNTNAFALSKIALTVRSIPIQQKKADPKDKKKDPADTDERKLEATLKNTSSEAVTGLQVHYYFIGKSAGANDLKVLDSDTKTQDVAPGTPVVIESKVATATFTPAHRTLPKKGSKDKPENVHAAGDKFTGWAVQVISGADLVAEAYSSPAMKAVVPAPTP
ncbi:MAG: hypothetical protein ABIT76_13870 [Chthoniobacterales bacterium]